MSEDDEGRPVPPRERCDPRVLEFLVCPITKGTLVYDAGRQELISRSARLAYPIRRGVPHLVPSEARHLDDPVPPASPRADQRS
ncbi:MAG: Trm112 family protein [Hyphomicrobiaceae bacterium]